MFRALTIAVVALIAFASGAIAADMQLNKAPPRVMAPVDDWGGPYIGVHGGYAWSRSDLGGITEFLGNIEPAGGLFGAQAGFRFHRSSVVFGLEADYSHLGVKDSQAIDSEVPAAFGVKVRDLASVRATLGFLLGQNLLVGASGGLGFGHTQAFANQDGKSLLSAEANSWGWTAGAFAEMKLPVFENWFLRAEYLHYDLGDVSYISGVLNSHVRADVVRAAVSYRFP